MKIWTKDRPVKSIDEIRIQPGTMYIVDKDNKPRPVTGIKLGVMSLRTLKDLVVNGKLYTAIQKEVTDDYAIRKSKKEFDRKNKQAKPNPLKVDSASDFLKEFYGKNNS